MFLRKIFIIVAFLIIFPWTTYAEENECVLNGGECVNAESCSEILDDLFNSSCGDGFVCCEVTGEADIIHTEGTEGGFLFFKGHIVPCGRSTDDTSANENDNLIDERDECTLCHLFIMLKNIFDLMISLLIVTAILFITIGGVIYIVSAGNTNMTGLAKEIIKKTLIGFALMLGSWLMVYALLFFLKAGENQMIGEGENWWEFNCDLESNFQGETPITSKTGEPDNANYIYSAADITNIPEQKEDISPVLQELLDCMQNKLPSEAKVISSISDSKGMENCQGENWTSDCAHKKNSCHYGGTNSECIGKSYAVDFKYVEYYDQIKRVAKECNEEASSYEHAGSHAHISVGGANNCGCN